MNRMFKNIGSVLYLNIRIINWTICFD